jgi:hypothetical protein
VLAAVQRVGEKINILFWYCPAAVGNADYLQSTSISKEISKLYKGIPTASQIRFVDFSGFRIVLGHSSGNGDEARVEMFIPGHYTVMLYRLLLDQSINFSSRVEKSIKLCRHVAAMHPISSTDVSNKNISSMMWIILSSTLSSVGNSKGLSGALTVAYSALEDVN